MENSFWRDAGLLVIGAIISLTTSIISEVLHDNVEEQKDKVAKKLELNHELSKDLGDRYYITYELMKARRRRDSVGFQKLRQDFYKCQEQWNQNIYSYQSLLRNYYGSDLEGYFIGNVYNPLIDLGLEAADTSSNELKDTTFSPRSNLLRDKTIKFISTIYSLSK